MASDDIWTDIDPKNTPRVFQKSDSLKTVRGSPFKYVALRDFKAVDRVEINPTSKQTQAPATKPTEKNWAGKQDRLFKLQQILNRLDKSDSNE